MICRPVHLKAIIEGVLVSLAVALLLSSSPAFAAGHTRPMVRTLPNPAGAHAGHVDPRVAEFNLELNAYRRDVAALYGQAQRLQAREHHLDSLATQLQTLGDVKQDWQLQLQDAMNKQAAAMQMLSNIMRDLNKTARAIIQNMKD